MHGTRMDLGEPEREAFVIGRTVSHYEIRRQLGTGAMGVVYEAWDTKLERSVALKFLHPDLTRDERLKKRFKHEALAASSLDHPNICYINEVDETEDGRLFISMAYYDGVSLSDRIREAAPLSTREAFQIGFSIAQGLASAHHHDIVHRDIKPANVMITSEGFVKIVDFGLAKLTGRSRVTISGTTVGTVAYMSPEQAIGENIDHRTDIWALGVILYEMVTGKLPFRGDIDQAMIYSIINEDPIPPHEVNKDVPKKCSDLIAKCLAKKVDERYQTTDELVADFGELAGSMGWGSSIAALTTPRVGSGVSVGRSRARSARRGSLAAMLVIVVVVAGWLYLKQRPGSIYTTDVRLAVLPIRNLGPPEFGPMVDGITEVATQMFDHASRLHRSMWVISSAYVAYARLADPADAENAFGVNRIITGDVQRFGDGFRLFLDYRDAATLESLEMVSVSFDPDTPAALADSLPVVVAHLLNLPSVAAELGEYLPGEPDAVRPYIDGVGHLSYNRVGSEFADAVARLNVVVARDPGFVLGRSALGVACFENYARGANTDAFYDRAIGYLTAAANLSPANWISHFNLGELFRRTGQDSAAAPAYRTALTIDPGNPSVSRRLADVYRNEDRFTEAEFVLRSATGKHPDLFSCHMMLGRHYFRVGAYREAVTALTRAIDLAQNDSVSHNSLGAALHKLGDWAPAREAFQKAFQLLPDCETCNNIGVALYYEARYEESAKYLEFQFEYCDSMDYKKWGNLASSLYWVKGGRERAFEILDKAITLALADLENNGDDPAVIGMLIEYYAMRGKKTEALPLIDRAKPFEATNADIMYSLGDAYALFGDREKALYYLGNAVRHHYSIPEILATRELHDLVKDDRFKQMVTRYEESLAATSETKSN